MGVSCSSCCKKQVPDVSVDSEVKDNKCCLDTTCDNCDNCLEHCSSNCCVIIIQKRSNSQKTISTSDKNPDPVKI